MLLRLFLQLFLVCVVVAPTPVCARTLGEVPFQYRDGLLWLKVCTADQREPLNLLLDSGASSSVLSIEAARRLNMRLGRSQPVYGVHSKAVAYRINGFKARVAGIALPESLLAVDLSDASSTVHQPIDGLVGADFFRGRIVQIDFATGRLRVLENSQPNSRSVVLPMKWFNSAICVPSTVGRSSSQWLRLDTGCESAVEWAPGKPMALENSVSRSLSIGLVSASIRYVHADVQLGSHALQGVLVGVHRQQIFPGESGLLGNKVLSQFRVTIDSPKRRVIFD